MKPIHSYCFAKNLNKYETNIRYNTKLNTGNTKLYQTLDYIKPLTILKNYFWSLKQSNDYTANILLNQILEFKKKLFYLL